MITSRAELRLYVSQDRKANLGKNDSWLRGVFLWLLHHESYYMFKYLRNLRYYEYYHYQYSNAKGVVDKASSVLPFIYRKVRYYHLSQKYRVCVVPNTTGPGLRLVHSQGGIILNAHSIGHHCVVSTGVVVGNKGAKEHVATIGDNVELCMGCKVIGKVNIGSNVIVAPNSVVIKDVPDNCVVSGVPAVIIKQRNQ